MARCRHESAFLEFEKSISDTPRNIALRVQTHEYCNKMTHLEMQACKRYIIRLQSAVLGPNPTSMNDITLSDTLRTTIERKSEINPDNMFMFYDSFEKDDSLPRILVFSSHLQQLIASKADHIFADGTYHITPNTVQCLYTIHAYVDNTCYPVVFILLPNETEETFTRAFSTLINVFSNVKFAHCDCQLSAINSLIKVFKVDIKLC
ncbi:hypothetical protein EIN_149980 [Entamoeba invadens IP1]|uniref:MULE transposase domain-containing protein n=1 Tax=Entamoeba invadens IP1 TaxID=370355 RepID=A0A0A1UEC1_ENTIV|nr:hypothetical protein EIN_149980 [Entamoeba invadens IP1]ELP91171.1 hypothetical protein EIN_149980 [Entamoeba invadens IP1]|eukprot:XP_004257942.1 hypothetical protein EIN_149980 [Entamoeba invadens IP1]